MVVGGTIMLNFQVRVENRSVSAFPYTSYRRFTRKIESAFARRAQDKNLP